MKNQFSFAFRAGYYYPCALTELQNILPKMDKRMSLIRNFLEEKIEIHSWENQYNIAGGGNIMVIVTIWYTGEILDREETLKAIENIK